MNYVNIPYLSSDTESTALQWYHDAVAFCLEQKLMDTFDGEFHVNDAAKRWEIVEALWRIRGEPESEHETSFADISADAPYADAVCWAASAEKSVEKFITRVMAGEAATSALLAANTSWGSVREDFL